jgi:hypothetical protein
MLQGRKTVTRRPWVFLRSEETDEKDKWVCLIEGDPDTVPAAVGQVKSPVWVLTAIMCFPAGIQSWLVT